MVTMLAEQNGALYVMKKATFEVIVLTKERLRRIIQIEVGIDLREVVRNCAFHLSIVVPLCATQR